MRGKLLHKNRKILSLNDTLLIRISTDLPVVVTELRALHLPQEVLVMSDDDELEVRLMLSSLDDLIQ
jgi:hypothetical protein